MTKGQTCAEEKIAKVMRERKAGTLHSGSKHGKIVHGKKQGIAIALSVARKKCGPGSVSRRK